MSFLRAEWRKLILANYEIDPKLLLPYLPYKTEIDLWQGRCYISVVGFLFKNTRLLGLKIPFHVNFPEANLRFYVRYKKEDIWRRGVVFIKEIVPRAAITWVANTFYKEHYETRRMKYLWNLTDQEQKIAYYWKRQKQWHGMQVTSDTEAQAILPESEAEFITEHYWGYSRYHNKQTVEYEVRHPRWQQYKVNNYQIAIDFKLNYGSDFEFLDNSKPTSVLLAEGSPITVENKTIIT